MSLVQHGSPYDLVDQSIQVKINPHVDKDITITWSGGKPSTIEVTALGKTKTLALSWTGDELQSIACVIT